MLSDDDDEFFEVLKEGQKDFCNLIEVKKLIINEQDITVRTCKKVEYTTSKSYENKRSACMACLNFESSRLLISICMIKG